MSVLHAARPGRAFAFSAQRIAHVGATLRTGLARLIAAGGPRREAERKIN